MKFLVIRHGETEWNKEEIFRGKKDIPLNDNGKSQAKKTAIQLAQCRIDKIYSSPLLRAKETASIIAERNRVPIYIMDEFTDMDFGIWEGLSLKKVKETYTEEFEIWRRYPQRWKIEGAETLKDVRKRVSKGIKLLINETSKDKTIAIVTHRVICKIISMIFLGMPNSGFWRIKFDPASISIFEYDGFNFVATTINETSHLRDVSSSYGDF